MKDKINFRSFGQSGPVCILLYGYGGKPQHWQAVAEKLALTHRVIVPHLSPVYTSRNPLFFTVQVELILQFIEAHFPNEPVHLSGVSYGGLLAWAMSIRRPSLFAKVDLVNPLLPSALDHVQVPELKYMLRVPFNPQTLALL